MVDPNAMVPIVFISKGSVVFRKNIKYVCDVYFLEGLIRV
jgi:hypothetical protein